MGNQKLKWTADEEEALLDGVAKHGPGKWNDILKDREFADQLSNRSNIDLKDKWRNLSVAPGIQGSKDKIRTPKMKAAVARMAAFSYNASHDLRYDGMIFEALSALANTNGSDVGAIVNFIEQRHEVPPNIRRILTHRLMRLAAQGKLVMVSHLKSLQNLYKMNDNSMGTIAMPSPRLKEVIFKLWQTNNQRYYGRMVKIADEADTIMEIVKEMQKTSL